MDFSPRSSAGLQSGVRKPSSSAGPNRRATRWRARPMSSQEGLEGICFRRFRRRESATGLWQALAIRWQARAILWQALAISSKTSFAPENRSAAPSPSWLCVLDTGMNSGRRTRNEFHVTSRDTSSDDERGMNSTLPHAALRLDDERGMNSSLPHAALRLDDERGMNSTLPHAALRLDDERGMNSSLPHAALRLDDERGMNSTLPHAALRLDDERG